MDAADLFGAVPRFGDAVRENRVIDQELDRIDPVRARRVTVHVSKKLAMPSGS